MRNEELYHYAVAEVEESAFTAALLDEIEERWYQYEVGG